MIMRNFANLVAVLSLICVCSPAFASWMGDIDFTTGTGTSGSKSSVDSRSMLFGELALRGGYQFGWFAPVVEGSYRYLGQLTKASSVGNTNMAGSGYLLGLGGNVDFGRIGLTAMYDLMGSFSLAKKTAAGSSLSYINPAGYRIILNYRLDMSWDLLLTYSSISYSKSKTDSGTTSISSDAVYQTLYGLGLAYRF